MANETGPLAVIRRDGSRTVVQHARVVNDTLVASPPDGVEGTPDVRIPMTDVARITRDEAEPSDAGRGALGLVIGALVGGLLVLALLAAAQ